MLGGLSNNKAPARPGIRTGRLIFISACIILFALALLSRFQLPSGVGSRFSRSGSSFKSPRYESVEKAKNSTLGFGAIYYLSLPYRTDRQDSMELIGALSGLNLTLVPGVDGASIHLKARPTKAGPGFKVAPMGCWRSHANAWLKLIKSGMSTALILEDDVDFSAGTRTSIMAKLAEEMQKGTLRIKRPEDGQRVEGPYGEDWDVLMVGHCSDAPNPNFKDAYQAWFDPYAPVAKDGKNSKKGLLPESEWADGEPRVRTLRPSYQFICTFGYAVTRQGALKLLYNTGVEGLTAPIDNYIDFLFRKGTIKGYTVSPTLFAMWLMDGHTDSDNNGRKPPEEDERQHTGKGRPNKELVASIRQQMAKDLGEGEFWSEFTEYFNGTRSDDDGEVDGESS